MSKAKSPEIIIDSNLAVDRLQREEEIALDLETGGLSPWKDPIAVVSLYGPQSNVAAILHVRGHMPEHLKKFLGEPGRRIITHNGTGFDYLFLAHAGVDILTPELYDTMPVEAALLTNGRNNNGVSLKATAKRRLGVELDKSLQKSTWMAPTLTSAQVSYCVGDIDYLPRIRRKQLDVVADDVYKQLAVGVETLILKPVIQMEMNGMPISLPELGKYLAREYDRVEQAHQKLLDIFGHINYNSPAQIKRAFQGKFNMELEATDKEHLKMLTIFGNEAVAEAAQFMLDYRYGNRRLQTYSPEWVQKYVYKGRVHARFWQCSTETGRFSCSEPNLQQIPGDMRAVFGHVPGRKFVRADYGQIEVRIIADYAKDTAMLEALGAEDFHRHVASQIMAVDPSQVSDSMRKLAKSMSFEWLFGGGVKKLFSYAAQAGSAITEPETRAVIQRFSERFPDVANLRTQAYAVTAPGHAIVRMPTGLTRVLSGAKCVGTTWLNTLGQGTAAAGIKLALYECWKMGISDRLICTVHDELDASSPEDEAEEYAEALTEAMVKGMNKVTGAPIAVEATITDSWEKPKE